MSTDTTSTASAAAAAENLDAAVEYFDDQCMALEGYVGGLREQQKLLEWLLGEVSETFEDFAQLPDALPSELVGDKIAAALSALAEAVTGDGEKALAEALEGMAAAEKALAQVHEAAVHVKTELEDMQAEYADARYTDATAWHTEH